MIVFGNKDFNDPTHITYVNHKDGLNVGFWKNSKLGYVFSSDNDISHFVKEYPKAVHGQLVNNETAQVISAVDFKKAELSKYFEITTPTNTSDTGNHVYDSHRKSKLVVAYATNSDIPNSLQQSHMIYGMLNNGSHSKNSIDVHIVDHRLYIVANVFGIYKQISTSSFDAAEDLLYSILYTFKQHGIPLTIPVRISGGLDKKGKLANLLTDYIPNLEWLAIPEKHLIEPSSDSHLFYEMYLAKQCV